MSITIRQADLALDKKLLIDTFFRYLTPLSDGRRFDWLYRHNPHGEARVWIATDTHKGAVVGIASAFPRRVCFDGSEELGWVLGDFCITDQYRSLGPALKLQRACLEDIDSGTVSFCIDFPSVNMMAVYKRLGINPLTQMLRLAKPLRIDRIIGKFLKASVITDTLNAASKFLLAISNRRPKNMGLLTIALHEGACGEEFSALAGDVSKQYGVCSHRSAQYLNWRYLSNPLQHYQLLTVRQSNTLLAYAVITHTGQDLNLIDLFGVKDPEIISSLVYGVVTLARKRNAVTVSMSITKSHPWIPFFHQLGFREREESPVVVYIPRTLASKRNVLQSVNWFLMDGDRDS